jgi:dienelactone hydrolase
MNENNCLITVVPEISYINETVDITISGLPKNRKVLFRAVSEDYYCINAGMSEQGQNSQWESYGVFIADDNGSIQLRNAIPMKGTYEKCNAMGLFYSMKIKELHKHKTPQNIQEIPATRNYTVNFTVEVNNQILASKKHIRMFCDEKIKCETIIENNFIARYFTHEKSEKRPAIIVLSGSDGRIEKAQAISQVFASKGYSALAVCYFGLDGTKRNLDRIPLEIIENAIKWLKSKNTVDQNQIAIYGRSKGGELALLAASFFPELTCVIANTPSCYVYEGLKNDMPSRHSSWTYRGNEVPYLKFSFLILCQMMIRQILGQKDLMIWMYNKIIKKGNLNQSSIKVEKINGPILLLSSSSDSIWPSLLHCETVIKRLTEKNFKFRFKHLSYEKSGHMLTLPYQSISTLDKCDGNLEEWAIACVDCWKETIEFLDEWNTANINSVTMV